MPTRDDLPDEIRTARTVVRKAGDGDLPAIEAWPPYPGWQYACFDMTGPPARSRNGEYWWRKIDLPDRCHYSVVLPDTGAVIGVHAFVRIDWKTPAVDNMGIRIRSDLCGQGFGTETLAPLLHAVLEAGMKSVRLDVAAANGRAIACYRKCGMRVTEEFWREHRGEMPRLDDPRWTFAAPHLREEDGKWMTRFFFMEIP
ncbi:MAG TPA: GNAT family N-acetyltransferase [Planctomycetota bacterium]|nr:GNAT family N-acetyltransferase [Planctomycetota bacterium]